MGNSEPERRQPLARLGVEAAKEFLDLGEQGVVGSSPSGRLEPGRFSLAGLVTRPAGPSG